MIKGWILGCIIQSTGEEHRYYLFLGTCETTTEILCRIFLYTILEGKWKYGDDSEKRNKTYFKPGKLLH